MGLSSAWSDQPRRLPGSAGNCGPESEQRGSPGLLLFLRTCLRVSFPASTVSQSVTRNGYHWVGVSHTGILYSECFSPKRVSVKHLVLKSPNHLPNL